jgi:putative ABC transport system permease protein
MLALDANSYVDMSERRTPPLRDLPLYRRLIEPGTTLVSENFAALNGVHLGDSITLPGKNGPVALKVVGTVVDFSNNRGTILVDRHGVGMEFTDSSVDIFAVGLGGVDPESARQAVNRSGWAAEHAVEAMTRTSLRKHILGMIRRLYGVAYVQEIVAAAVAALGVSAAMLICVVQRRRELSLLRSLGATSDQLFCTVIAEAAAMAAIGMTLGVLLGLGLEWYVLRVILLQETGFRFPVFIPWSDVLMVSLVVGLAALIAGVAPALSAARIGTRIGLSRE